MIKPPRWLIKLSAWMVILVISLYQYQVMLNPERSVFGDLSKDIVSMLLLCFASTLGAFIVRMVFITLYGRHIAEDEKIANHYAVAEYLGSAIVYIAALVGQFGRFGFWTGLGSAVLLVVIYMLNALIGLPLLGTIWAFRSWGGYTPDSKPAIEENPAPDSEEEKERIETSRCSIYRGFGMSRSKVGEIYHDGRVFEDRGVLNNVIGSVSADGTVYSGSGVIGFINSSGSVYRGNECIGEVSCYGTVYRGTGLSKETVGETDSGPLAQKGGAALLLLFMSN